MKIDKRNSAAQNSNQRMSQSQSMDMQSSYHQRNHSVNNNNILMNLSKEAASRSMSRTHEYDSSPLATPIRSPMVKSSPQHPYVNLMHQQSYNIPPYQLQYQNNATLSNQSTPDASNQSWSGSQPIPLVTHYTAAQIYMRPKVNVNSYNYQNSSAYSSLNKKPPPPEVPKRLSSSISTGSTASLKKSNGLSRSSE